jgi:hypothetical protein
VRCTSIRYTPMRCTPVRYTPMRNMPMKYTPIMGFGFTGNLNSKSRSRIIIICQGSTDMRMTLTLRTKVYSNFDDGTQSRSCR